ncbi:MAG: sulfatase-like hydrolase/transferase [Bacteroidota bacterium]
MLNKSHLFWATLTWILFFLWNSLLFFPAYAVDCQLHLDTEAAAAINHWWTPFLQGDYTKFYQICGDFVLLLLPVFFLPKKSWLQRIYLPLAGSTYLLLLYYKIYSEGYKGMYAVHPVFAKDWVIVKEILPTFLREVSVTGGAYLLSFLGFIGISVVLFLGMLFLQRKVMALRKAPVFWLTGCLIILLGAFTLPNINQRKAERKLATSSEDRAIIIADSLQDTTAAEWINWIYPDIRVSATLDRADHLAHLEKRWTYDFYQGKKLVKKPNIFLIFVESYGAVASMTDYCEHRYAALAETLSEDLARSGWSVASNYSKSTVIGGRSWLAMTTTMVGARIEDQIQYSELIKNRLSYPHMVHFFNQQGYDTYRASTMRIRMSPSDSLKMITIPNRFWKFDHRYFFPDIPYEGYQYDLFGGIPDQYTLGYVTDHFLPKNDQPFFYTSITMNSHGPWHHKMPPVVDDYRTLNDLQRPFGNEVIGKDMHITSYWTAIDYQLRMLAKYIQTQGRDDSIYIIMGDHNPGGLEWKLYQRFNKWAVPIHIISKDTEFVKSFHQHGFTEGMQVDTAKFKMMRHMGLYSLLTRQLLENYGEKAVVLPEYLPWGL